jgi:GntP family gluconate:H+ symporter
MQIYWGAVPFVIIQIIMVGLIIAFPGIVSSGLDKEEGLNAEQVQLEMMNATHDSDASGGAPTETATPVPGTESDSKAEEDPMKMLQESMNKDAAKK